MWLCVGISECVEPLFMCLDTYEKKKERKTRHLQKCNKKAHTNNLILFCTLLTAVTSVASEGSGELTDTRTKLLLILLQTKR